MSHHPTRFVVVLVLPLFVSCSTNLHLRNPYTYSDVRMGNAKGVVVTSPNVLEDIPQLPNAGSDGFFVPTESEIGFADASLHRFAEAVSARREKLGWIWFGWANTIADNWDECQRVYVGYSEQGNRYVYIQVLQPEWVDTLDREYYQGAWKEHLFIWSDDPGKPYNPLERVDLATGQVEGFQSVIDASEYVEQNP